LLPSGNAVLAIQTTLVPLATRRSAKICPVKLGTKTVPFAPMDTAASTEAFNDIEDITAPSLGLTAYTTPRKSANHRMLLGTPVMIAGEPVMAAEARKVHFSAPVVALIEYRRALVAPK